METIYKPINPYSSDAKRMKTRTALTLHENLFNDYPNFHKSGSIIGMKNLYYGKGALLVKCGDYIYNVSSNPELYYQYAI